MTREEIVEGLKLLEDNMVYFDELQNDKGEWIDVHELFFEAIQALSQECVEPTHKHVRNALDMRCDDAVSREAVREILSNARLGESKLAYELDKLPSVTQKSESVTEFADRCRECGKMRKGHWISHYDEDAKEGWYECDRCHTERAFNTDYCPDCGAKMESEDKE